MSLLRPKVELIVIRDPLNPHESIEYYSGRKLEDLVKQAFDSGISDSVRFYHNSLTKEVFGLDERKDKKAIKAFCILKGRVYAQVVPMGLDPVSWAIIGASVAVSLAATFLFAPKPPEMGTQTQPPSPNNSLSSRSNTQRLGGRVPDIFGEVWSVPDLIAPTYSVYVDHKEVEYSYMCVGRGKYEVKQALDDTTPIKHVDGASVLVYDPDTNLNDEPAFVFGDQFNSDDAEHARYAAKKYTSVNGQELPFPDNYDVLPVSFEYPNKLVVDESLGYTPQVKYSAGGTITIEDANNLGSSTNAVDVDDSDLDNVVTTPVTYSLSGSYTVSSVVDNVIELQSPELVSSDWNKLTENTDATTQKDITISQESEPYWKGYYYSDGGDYDGFYINIIALNGIYVTFRDGSLEGRMVEGVIESEIVDVNGNPIANTLHQQDFYLASPAYEKTILNNEGGAPSEDIRRTAARTIEIKNPNYQKGDRIRFRVCRTTDKLIQSGGQVVQDIKLKDFYSYRRLTDSDMPSGVTTVYSKTLATEGALSIKERKLRLLVERYVADYYTKELKLSKRADDTIYHIATDQKIGNLTDEQIDFEQIKSEVDAIVAYFGSEKFAQFCYTFDSDNLSSEESIQAVARAVFSNAKRYGNKLMLDFEREVPASVAVFNSHNILPDTYSESQSFGVLNDYDGAKVEWTDPSDDAKVTMSYPHDALTNPHKEELIGVRNELQATAHMMRIYNKDQNTNKSCEFTAGDESNTVTRTNRVTVVSQADARVQQGTVDGLEVIDSDIVLHTTDPVELSDDAYLFIQTINNGVESIPCSPRDDYSVTLARLPQGEISTDWQNAVRAVYQIASSNDGDRDAYIVTEKDPAEAMTNKLTCTNYSSKFYQNDKDYLKSLT